jgi:transcriptional regulator with XRE-family HTH domain
MSLVDVLGETIKTERRRRNISQEKLATRAGLNRAYFSDVERGTRNPSIKTIGKIAEALELQFGPCSHRQRRKRLRREPEERIVERSNSA